MADHNEQEVLNSKVRGLETETSVLTQENQALRSQLDYRQFRLSEDDHEGHGFFEDLSVSEKKVIETDFGANEEFAKLLLEYFNGIFFKGTADGKLFSLSGDFEKITGYSKNQLALDANTWTSLIHPEDLNSVKDEINQLTSVPV